MHTWSKFATFKTESNHHDLSTHLLFHTVNCEKQVTNYLTNFLAVPTSYVKYCKNFYWISDYFERDRKCQTTYLLNDGKNQTLLIKMNTRCNFWFEEQEQRFICTNSHVYWIFAKCKIAIALTSHYDKNAKNLIT